MGAHEGDRLYAWTPADEAANYLGLVDTADDVLDLEQGELEELFKEYIGSGVVNTKVEDGQLWVWSDDLPALLFAETWRMSGVRPESHLVDEVAVYEKAAKLKDHGADLPGAHIRNRLRGDRIRIRRRHAEQVIAHELREVAALEEADAESRRERERSAAATEEARKDTKRYFEETLPQRLEEEARNRSQSLADDVNREQTAVANEPPTDTTPPRPDNIPPMPKENS